MDATIATWRVEQRKRLLAQRRALSPEQRRQAATRVAEALDAWLANRPAKMIGLYWPIQHEMDLIPWAETRANTVFCLPVVVTPKAALEYWRWTPGDPLARGFWGIPVPDRRDPVHPDLVLAPMVGFDRANYRLGYGGGYFDRTLASLSPRPLAIGIAYTFSALDTIFPQPHDIPMDAVLTGDSDRRD